MIGCMKAEDVESDATPEQTIKKSSTTTTAKAKDYLAEILVPRASPSSINSNRHIVIVVDPLKQLSRELLQWTFDHVVPSGCTVTLLGVMPWLPFAFSCKAKFWTYDFGNLFALKGRSEWKNDQIRGIIELCERKGVVPHMQLAMGHPMKLVVLEKTSNLHASMVVLGRHLRKNKAFFAERLPSIVVMMNSDGGVDMIKGQSTITSCDSSPDQETPETPPPTKVIVSEAFSEKPVKNECRNPESLLTRTKNRNRTLFWEAMQNTIKIVL